MGEPTTTRGLVARHLWQLRRLGYRLEEALPMGTGWREYWLRPPGRPRGFFGPLLHASAPPKQEANRG